ncbi:hypothetical protein RFI_36613 [Reticulomyxa filosa]|uniref:Kelch motif family protein n=1 Tax=Reticulomyxa filosa TaxID=46433 RepID=X6LHH4_RETFI|nr:hypothetical protein RFI_36613 [Reticulomyxa filosa]|eukprot:ETO00826.1 hypothetical protein RFI_36613 [Reticulomyxa filosa]
MNKANARNVVIGCGIILSWKDSFSCSSPFEKSKFSNINNMNNQAFQTLKELPTPLKESQCVSHKYELLICGGYEQRACYSYHTLKNEYQFICEYPRHVELYGHCVVKMVDNNNKNSNQITLLSFGGVHNHTLVMKYVSVWGNISNKSSKSSNFNRWIPFTDNHNRPIIIGREQDDYGGVRAVIGGSSNHLLFITHFRSNISVFDLNTFQFIQHDTLPTDNIQYYCFVLKSKNERREEMMKTNKQNYQMLLFCRKIGLSIEYDEGNNSFQFHQLSVCKDIAPLYKYAYVCINDVILFFGGWSYSNAFSKSVYKYSIRENKWMTFDNTLSNSLNNCVAILSEEDNDIHIIGGENAKKTASKNEIKYIIEYWIRNLKIRLGWIDDFDKIIMKYSR